MGKQAGNEAKETLAQQPSFTSRNTKLTKTQGTDQYQQVGCSFIDRSGNIWFGTTGEGVYRYDGKVFTQFTKKDGLCGNGIRSLVGDTSGNIWFGAKEAISRFDGKQFITIAIPGVIGSNFQYSTAGNNNPATKNELWSMLRDRSGKIWLGTTNGIYCFDPSTSVKADAPYFTRFLDDQRIQNKANVSLKWTQCMFEDKSGNIWFGSWVPINEGVCRYDGKLITQFKPYGEGWVRSILEDKKGALLIVTRHNGVCRFDGQDFTNFTEKGGPQNASITTALADKAGNLWFGTELGSGELNEDGGLWRYDGKSFIRFTRKDGLCHNGVFSLVEDAAGHIWLGGRNTSLCRLDGKTFSSFSD